MESNPSGHWQANHPAEQQMDREPGVADRVVLWTILIILLQIKKSDKLTEMYPDCEQICKTFDNHTYTLFPKRDSESFYLNPRSFVQRIFISL